jgi:hypothetical protein
VLDMLILLAMSCSILWIHMGHMGPGPRPTGGQVGRVGRSGQVGHAARAGRIGRAGHADR